MKKTAFERILLDRPVAFHPALAHGLGSVTAALFLSQLLFWTAKLPKSRAGWLWKSQREMQSETGLSRYEQRTARRILVKAGAIQEKRKGTPATMWYRVDLHRVEKLIAISRHSKPRSRKSVVGKPTIQFAGKQPTGLRKTRKLVRGKPGSKSAGNPQTRLLETSNLITEITPKSTSEKTSQTTASAAAVVEKNRQAETRVILSQAGVQGAGLDRLSKVVSPQVARQRAAWIPKAPESFKFPVGYLIKTLRRDPDAPPPGQQMRSKRRVWWEEGYASLLTR